ncbi:hypothetical protein ACTMTI_50990 [Nonomuraea sp. H19]|uniref:hypothetical protein n=1 Tax=Nonomuraea sp. H19 TaxID=3452206 RepID=UPI003F888695
MSIEPVGTMFAALHGRLTPHAWRDPRVASSDAYSLFLARSSAMGWLADTAAGSSGGLWGMNDAGHDITAGRDTTAEARPTRVAWFQVSLAEPARPRRPLPVQPFLSCAGDVVARIGVPRLEAVQVLLPVQSLHPPSRPDSVMNLLQDTGWFADRDPRARTRVRVTLDSGQDPAIGSAATTMVSWLREFQQEIFSLDSITPAERNEPALGPAITDELWRGPAHHRVTLRGDLAEWSLDALGWLSAFLADVASHAGVATPLLLTARPSAEILTGRE